MEINHKNVILYGAVQYYTVSLILMTMEVDVHVHVFLCSSDDPISFE